MHLLGHLRSKNGKYWQYIEFMPSVSKAFNKIKVRRKWKIHIFCRNLQTTRDNICSKHYCSRYACDVLSLFFCYHLFWLEREQQHFRCCCCSSVAVIAAVTVVFVVAVTVVFVVAVTDANFVTVTAAAVASIAAVVALLFLLLMLLLLL
jgi:hypothetical protein